MENPEFSIIVPIYNVAPFLPTCIESVLNQTFQNYELILVNDGSPDNSLEICKEYQNKDSRVHIIDKENGGLVSARKAGALQTKGEYVLNLDGDDFYDSRLLEIVDSIIKESNPDVICFEYMKYIKENHIEKVDSFCSSHLFIGKELDDLLQKFLFNFDINGTNSGAITYSIWSKVVRRELYCNAQMKVPDNVYNGEDTIVTAHILNECNSLYCLKRSLYYYRRNLNSMTQIRASRDLENVINVTKELLKIDIVENNAVFAYAICQLWAIMHDFVHAGSSFRQYRVFIGKKDYQQIFQQRMKLRGIGLKIKALFIKSKAAIFTYLLIKVK